MKDHSVKALTFIFLQQWNIIHECGMLLHASTIFTLREQTIIRMGLFKTCEGFQDFKDISYFP